MGFDVKRIFRISSDKHGRKVQQQQPQPQQAQTDTDSPSEDDVYSQRLRNGAASNGTNGTNGASHRPWAASSSTSLWSSSRSKDSQQNGQNQNQNQSQSQSQNQLNDNSSSRGVRKKASRIGRGKDSGGYFNSLAAGGGAPVNNSEPQLDKMFDGLRDPSEDPKDALGVESTMGYLTSLGLDPASGEVFVALDLVQAPNFAEVTRKGFVDGWKATGYTTIEEQSKYVASLVKRLESDPAYFKQVYRYTFGAGKEKDQRSMGLENAIEFWKVLFAPPGRPWKTASRDWTPLWVEFLQEKWTRSVNRDMWNQTLEFAIKCSEDETLGFWNEDGAWPSVIDDFVAWCNEKGYASSKKDSMDTTEE